MKRTLLVLVLCLICAVSGWTQTTFEWEVFQSAFQDFSSEVASALPAISGASGLSWSPAYTGQFPHFGFGVALSTAVIPYSTIEPLFTGLGLVLPASIESLENYGIPIPTAIVDARVGGFGFPFDLGFKFGYIPESIREHTGMVNVEQLLFGGDFRYPILKGGGILPALSMSLGYTYLRTS